MFTGSLPDLRCEGTRERASIAVMKLKIMAFVMAPVLLGIWLASTAAVKKPAARIRVMSYNIHHGEGVDGKIDVERIANLIRKEQADIVGLQEVDRGVERTMRRDLAGEIARQTGMNVYFDCNLKFQGGDYGNAILSRFPILTQTNLHYRMLRPNEQRGLLQVTLDVDGRPLRFMNTHIDSRQDDAERLANAEEIRALLAAAPATPVILCGDFNSEPASRVHRKFQDFLRDAWEVAGQGTGYTFPSTGPEKRIDYLWTLPTGGVHPRRLWTRPAEASDHAALIGEFELAD